MSVDGPSELHLPGRAFLDIGRSFLFLACHAFEVPADDEQLARFAGGVRTVDKPRAELQSLVDRTDVPERVDAEPADHGRFEPEVAKPVRDLGRSLELLSWVAVRPADVLTQEVEHLGQSLFVAEFLQLLRRADAGSSQRRPSGRRASSEASPSWLRSARPSRDRRPGSPRSARRRTLFRLRRGCRARSNECPRSASKRGRSSCAWGRRASARSLSPIAADMSARRVARRAALPSRSPARSASSSAAESTGASSTR